MEFKAAAVNDVSYGHKEYVKHGVKIDYGYAYTANGNHSFVSKWGVGNSLCIFRLRFLEEIQECEECGNTYDNAYDGKNIAFRTYTGI